MKPLYLDHNATTPVRPEVVEAMLPYFTEHFGNAASRQHAFGWHADDAVETARHQVARLIGARAKEIVFTSGGTEGDNLAVLGYARGNRDKGAHLVTTAIEHPAVQSSRVWTRGALRPLPRSVMGVPVDLDGLRA